MGVSPALMQRYLTGEEAVPDGLVLAAIDVVLAALPERPAAEPAFVPISAAGD